MKRQFEPNDTVLYGANGVCRVVEIQQKDLAGQPMEYYVLQPVYADRSLIYVPTQNDTLTAKMRRILSADEVFDLIHRMPQEEDEWIIDETTRREKFHRVLVGGDPSSLIRMIRSLYRHQQKMKEQGKKLRQADERAFREGEKLLYDEFALVLHIEPEQVLPFILQEIGLEQKEE